jgi:hypothetical protein
VLANHVPSVASNGEFADAGILMSYGELLSCLNHLQARLIVLVNDSNVAVVGLSLAPHVAFLFFPYIEALEPRGRTALPNFFRPMLSSIVTGEADDDPA